MTYISTDKNLYSGKGVHHNMAIVIDGIIGAGKSTVAAFLCEELDLKFYEELSSEASDSLAQRMLDKFYSDQGRWSAIIQVMFLNERFKSIKDIESMSENAVVDRSIYGDEIFAKTIHDRGQMTDDEFQIYKELLQNMLQHIKPPEIMIYLDVSVDTALERIKVRDRSTEADLIPRDYMEDLRANYEAWFDTYTLSKKVRIDFNEDAMTDDGQLTDALKNKILEAIK